MWRLMRWEVKVDNKKTNNKENKEEEIAWMFKEHWCAAKSGVPQRVLGYWLNLRSHLPKRNWHIKVMITKREQRWGWGQGIYPWVPPKEKEQYKGLKK